MRIIIKPAFKRDTDRVANLVLLKALTEKIEQIEKAPTPKFFRVLRNMGLALAAVSGIITAAPIALPAALVTVAGYLTIAGGVIGAVSQVAVDGESDGKIMSAACGGSSGGGGASDPIK
jgi:hypothetical protein